MKPANPFHTLVLLLTAVLAVSATHGEESPNGTRKARISPGRPIQHKGRDAAATLLTIDFETTRAGEIPRGFTKEGAVAVTDETAHTGKKCLKIDPALNGPRRIIKEGDEITRLGGQHWGRLYLKVKLPAPVPVVPPGQNFAVIHSTIVEGKAISPLAHDPIAVRLADTCTGPEGKLQYIYNVQPSKRPEFGKGSPYEYKFSDQWTLIEWFVDHATQTYRLYVGGKEIRETGVKNGAGNFVGAEIPEVFESLSFGWNNYQPAGEGFTAWIDDIALAKERIGESGLEK